MINNSAFTFIVPSFFKNPAEEFTTSKNCHGLALRNNQPEKASEFKKQLEELRKAKNLKHLSSNFSFNNSLKNEKDRKFYHSLLKVLGCSILLIGAAGLGFWLKNSQIGLFNQTLPETINKMPKQKQNKEETLETLIQSAHKEDDAFLIDFSRVNPSNIFKIFGNHYINAYGEASISDTLDDDESNKFIHNFPFKYSIRIICLEKNENEYTTLSNYMFTMNDDGKVESYGTVFDNFDLYLESFLKDRIYFKDKYLSFDHFDFYSVSDENIDNKLRKKSSALFA
jgi:hypothetical protein